jgi:carbamoyl-phosphate synthase large subunit
MVNCNPETVSTDYDTSDRLYFEPLTLEDVLNIYDTEKPDGVIVQFGGQTPLNLALPLQRAGVPIIGTDPKNIDLAEDRKLFGKLLEDLNIPCPPNGTATSVEEACEVAGRLGYPVLVRPSYVLGGRAMEIVHGDKDLQRYMREAVRVSEKSPVLLDRFLEDAIEVDVDCISDGEDVMIGGIMEHVEAAGIHSGDSACSLPPYSLSPALQDELRRQTVLMAKALKVIGLMNTQFAIQGEGDEAVVYVLEVNPRASRTVPFVSKATGQPLAKIAARCMAGMKLRDQRGGDGRVPHEVIPPYFSIKEAVFPFNKFPGVDPILGPEMRSTGEVMGVGRTFGEAMLKSQLGAGSKLPEQGTVVITVKDTDKDRAVKVASDLADLGFQIVATRGTAVAIAQAGVPVKVVNKVKDGRPHIADMVKAGEIQLVFTTVDETRTSIADSRYIRTAALANRVTYYTTMAGCEAATEALKHDDDLAVLSLQELHAELP